MLDIDKNAYVACICEGNSEMTIMNLLVEKNALVFSNRQLLNKKVFSPVYFRDSNRFTNQFLTMDYGSRQLCVLLIQDRKNVSYGIKPPYLDKINGPYFVITAPEIEMLMIHSLGLFEEYKKTQQIKKPSVFLAEYNKSKTSKLKSSTFIEGFFQRYNLVEAIQEHKRQAQSLKQGQLFLADILR